MAVTADMERHHAALYDLCDHLEAVADQLPDRVDRQYCLHLARMIYPVVKSAHEFEENVVFPALQVRSSIEPSLQSSLERLQFEHWEDESYAIELSESLFAIASGRLNPTSEYFGYMLRGFFESMRRHIAFEVEHIGPMLQDVDSSGSLN